MSDKNSHTFTSAFRKFLVNEKLDVKYREKLLIESWETIMGKPIASRTTKLYIRDKILMVHLNSAPLKHEMQNHKSRIMEILAKDFSGLVVDVKFL